MLFLLIFKSELFVHLHLCDVSYRKIKKLMYLFPCFKLILFGLRSTFSDLLFMKSVVLLAYIILAFV